MAKVESEILNRLTGVDVLTSCTSVQALTVPDVMDEQIVKEDGRNVMTWILDMSEGKRKRKKLAKWLWNEANTAEKMLTYRLLGKADYNAIIQACTDCRTAQSASP